ncbi:MAG: hypothetical protein GF390_01735 [Candidatus Pacebacteria bacterium]|nr:hypothetical protein [Candidatus Paceibacterota bacterium]
MRSKTNYIITSTMLILGLLINFSFVNPVIAQSAPAQNQQQAQGQTESANKQNQAQQQLQQQSKQQLIHQYTKRLRHRFMAVYHTRLNSIANRLSERLQIMSDNGHDVQAAQEKLHQAQDKLASAQQQADQALNQLEDLAAEDQAAPAEQIDQAKTELLAARKGFVKTITLLKQSIQLAKQAA